MKTDDLIEMLSTNVEPVTPGQMSRSLRNALVIAASASVVAVVAAFGVRHDAMHGGGARSRP